MVAIDLTRRSFLKGAGIGALTATSLGLLGGCAPQVEPEAEVIETVTGSAQATGELTWLGLEPADPENIEEELEADVVIVGCGTAGTCAARAAAEEGASVIVVEKAGAPAVCRSGQWAVIGGETNKRWERGEGQANYVDPDEVVEVVMTESQYYPNRAILSKWAKNNGEVFDWFIAAKPDLFISDKSTDPLPPVETDEDCSLWVRHHPLPESFDLSKERVKEFQSSVSFNPSQQPVLTANWRKAEEAGAVCYVGHFAEKLIKESGRVVGLFARNAETGAYKKVMAKNGVLLAGGDISNNPDMQAYYAPDLVLNGVGNMWMNMDVEGNFTNTGDCAKLGSWVGGKLQQKAAPMVHYMGHMSTIGAAPYMSIDVNGKRFTNEDISALQFQSAVERIPEKRFWTIFDASWTEQLSAFQPRFASTNYVVDSPTPENLLINDVHPYVTRDAVEKACETGGSGMLKGETIDELISKLEGLRDAAAAKASVERYNELAKAGKDEDFGKPASRMFPIENGPFYAFSSGMNMNLVTIVGFEGDADCHVFDANDEIIPGLYAAGNAQGGRFAVNYIPTMSGMSHSIAMYYGYVAGKNMAQGI
ncbi:MAG: FAD-dependent oxidoreductase [Eggerthellaceae bacterium]|nr:FAD-dependent oxidoreductase [Eggerthellaceae bacterium]